MHQDACGVCSVGFIRVNSANRVAKLGSGQQHSRFFLHMMICLLIMDSQQPCPHWNNYVLSALGSHTDVRTGVRTGLCKFGAKEKASIVRTTKEWVFKKFKKVHSMSKQGKQGWHTGLSRQPVCGTGSQKVCNNNSSPAAASRHQLLSNKCAACTRCTPPPPPPPPHTHTTHTHTHATHFYTYACMRPHKFANTHICTYTPIYTYIHHMQTHYACKLQITHIHTYKHTHAHWHTITCETSMYVL